MGLRERHNLNVLGDGPMTLVFAHGFGCDQNMWRFLAPEYASRYRTILYDLVGSGRSDLAAYDRTRYGSLRGHALDALEIIEAHATGPVVFVGHSVSAMIGLLAGLEAPGRIAAHAMIGPSPCYINDGQYTGGFSRDDIESLLETMEANYLGWSSSMAPVIMGAPGQPELAQELTNSFCRTDPDIAAHFARITFLSDNRNDLARLDAPALILQCSDDIIAPCAVGEYMHRVMPRSTLKVVRNVGHCPHLSEPQECARLISEFIASLEPGREPA
jgi:sigma-B regulation protein RsbQ